MSSAHARGVALVCISAIAFSTAGLFTKGVSAEAWNVIFWRGVSAAAFTFIYVVWRGGLGSEVRRFGWPAGLALLLSASGTAAFIPAFKLTSISNVSMIWATAPFLTALLAWLVLSERPSRAGQRGGNYRCRDCGERIIARWQYHRGCAGAVDDADDRGGGGDLPALAPNAGGVAQCGCVGGVTAICAVVQRTDAGCAV